MAEKTVETVRENVAIVNPRLKPGENETLHSQIISRAKRKNNTLIENDPIR